MREEEEAIKRKFELLAGDLNERTRRMTAAAEAMALGWGGISVVARATGVSHRAIRQGIKELKAEEVREQGRIRRLGGGRKKTVSKDASLYMDLERLVKPVILGDPMSPALWTSKSLRKLAAELEELGHNVSHQLVCDLLHDIGFSYRPNPKLYECRENPDRFSRGGFVWHP
jgi:transposase